MVLCRSRVKSKLALLKPELESHMHSWELIFMSNNYIRYTFDRSEVVRQDIILFTLQFITVAPQLKMHIGARLVLVRVGVAPTLFAGGVGEHLARVHLGRTIRGRHLYPRSLERAR